jgi:hypothetical protein
MAFEWHPSLQRIIRVHRFFELPKLAETLQQLLSTKCSPSEYPARPMVDVMTPFSWMNSLKTPMPSLTDALKLKFEDFPVRFQKAAD